MRSLQISNLIGLAAVIIQGAVNTAFLVCGSKQVLYMWWNEAKATVDRAKSPIATSPDAPPPIECTPEAYSAMHRQLEKRQMKSDFLDMHWKSQRRQGYRIFIIVASIIYGFVSLIFLLLILLSKARPPLTIVDAGLLGTGLLFTCMAFYLFHLVVISESKRVYHWVYGLVHLCCLVAIVSVIVQWTRSLQRVWIYQMVLGVMLVVSISLSFSAARLFHNSSDSPV